MIRALVTRLFGRSSRSDVSDRLDHATVAIFRRLNLLETTMSASFASVSTKIDQLGALLDAKTATVDDHATELATLKTDQATDLDALDSKVDALIAKHTPPAAAAPDVDPVTGIAVTQ